MHDTHDTWPFEQAIDDGHVCVAKHDIDDGVVGKVTFENLINGNVRLTVERYDEAKFGNVEVVVR